MTKDKIIILRQKDINRLTKYFCEAAKYVPQKVQITAKWQRRLSRIISSLGINIENKEVSPPLVPYLKIGENGELIKEKKPLDKPKYLTSLPDGSIVESYDPPQDDC